MSCLNPSGVALPIHLIGESHVLVFKDVLYRPAESDVSYACRTRFFPSLRAREYSDDAFISHEYMTGLIADGIIDEQMRPAFLHADPGPDGLPLIAPPMVLFAGDLDLHQMFRLIWKNHDFLMPEDPGYGVDASKQLMTYADVRDHIVSFLVPFFVAIEQLRAAGFTRMMIHALPPRTPDNAAAARWTNSLFVDAPVRAKLTILANRALAEFCEFAGMPFIDIWPETTEDGYLKPEFDLDGVHMSAKSASISLEKITAALVDQTDGMELSAVSA